ncbi:MAG: hypothetical protein JKX70_11730, partial [Phycisphaerales bacterium]|nr:hypothetical protein [Phycisphaerales bacterium]
MRSFTHDQYKQQNHKSFPILIPLHLQLFRLPRASGGGGRAAAGGVFSHPSSPSPSPDRSIATLTNELLEDLTNPSMSAFEMCQIHHLTLIELAAILNSESFKIAVEAIEKIANARQQIIEPEARALASARLADILKDKPTTPAHAETQRKAATQLLR